MIENVLIATPPEHIHSQALWDVAMAFSQALKELGHPAHLTVDEHEGKTLIFGAHLAPRFGGELYGDYIVYQTEQISSGSVLVNGAYLDLLRRFEVWDYSAANVTALKEYGIEAKHVAVGYMPCLSNIARGKSVSLVRSGELDYAPWSNGVAAGVLDIDVCFFGSKNERREKVIDGLKAAGLTVASFVGYGAYRDKIIARSKVCLNMHYYEGAPMEIFRVGYLLANRKLVVSEKSQEEIDGPIYADYDNLVNCCVMMAKDDIQRRVLEDRGFADFKRVRQTDILKGIL